MPPPPPTDDDALVRAADATRHAEELQRQHAHRQQIGLPEPELDAQQRQQVDAHVDRIEGLSEHQRRFLKSHPSLLHEPYLSLMRHAVMVARHAGVPNDTEAFDRAVLAGVARDIEHHHALKQLTAADARPTPENAQAHQDVNEAAAELQREADEHLAAEQPAPVAPPPPRRNGIPISAPVSREAPMPSGQRQSDGWNTLTAEERKVARTSFTDPNMSNEQKELLYLKNRQKLHAMRANGSYSERDRN